MSAKVVYHNINEALRNTAKYAVYAMMQYLWKKRRAERDGGASEAPIARHNKLGT